MVELVDLLVKKTLIVFNILNTITSIQATDALQLDQLLHPLLSSVTQHSPLTTEHCMRDNTR